MLGPYESALPEDCNGYLATDPQYLPAGRVEKIN